MTTLCNRYYARTLPEYSCESTAARVQLDRSFRVSATTAPSPVIYHIRYKPSLPSSHHQHEHGVATASHLSTIPITFSDFFFNNKLVKMIGPTALFLSSHLLYVHSLFRCEESDADKLPADGSTGGLCSTTFSHCLFIDKFYALQNGLPNGSQQILTLTTLRNGLLKSFRPAPSSTPPFLATQPTAVNILVDWKSTPEPASTVARTKSGTCPMS